MLRDFVDVKLGRSRGTGPVGGRQLTSRCGLCWFGVRLGGGKKRGMGVIYRNGSQASWSKAG